MIVGSSSSIGYAALQGQQKAFSASPIEEIIEKAKVAESQSEGQKALQRIQGTSKGGGSLLDSELSEEEQKEVEELKARDQEVRAHEQAHKTVGGPYAGAISYETQTGPDGKEYAVGGEVQIDASPVPGNPEATVRKLDIVIRAALAPAEPSSQDFAVARAAQAGRLQAQREVREQQDAERAEQRAENNEESAVDKGDSLNGEQKSQLNQLLESIDAIQSPSSLQRGSLIDAIN
jgi:hypothetical protein